METTTVCTKVEMDPLRSRSLSADEKWSALCEWAGLGARTASSHNVADVIQAMTSKAMSRSVAEKLERRAKAGQPGRFVIKNKRAYLQVVSIYEGSSNVLAMPPGDPAVRPVLAWTPFREACGGVPRRWYAESCLGFPSSPPRALSTTRPGW